MPKMNVNAFLQKDYENEPPSGSKKTNPIKANFRKAKMNKKSLTGKSGHTRTDSYRKFRWTPKASQLKY